MKYDIHTDLDATYEYSMLTIEETCVLLLRQLNMTIKSSQCPHFLQMSIMLCYI